MTLLGRMTFSLREIFGLSSWIEIKKVEKPYCGLGTLLTDFLRKSYTMVIKLQTFHLIPGSHTSECFQGFKMFIDFFISMRF